MASSRMPLTANSGHCTIAGAAHGEELRGETVNFRTKRQSRPAPGVVYVPEEELPEDLRRARRSYLAAVERHTASVKAANVASKANTSKEKAKREDLQLAEIHDEQDQDTAYGYLARIAHAAGFRACLCGKIERVAPEPQ